MLVYSTRAGLGLRADKQQCLVDGSLEGGREQEQRVVVGGGGGDCRHLKTGQALKPNQEYGSIVKQQNVNLSLALLFFFFQI